VTPEDLSQAVAAAGLRLPEYGGQNLDGVLLAVAGALGADIPGAAAAAERLAVPAAARVCVVLVDGLGHQMLTERAGHAPFLRRHLPQTQVLTVGYPSTTAASIGLFGTGQAAGRTGLAGYTVRNPASGRLANLVSWDGVGAGWQREPSVFRAIIDHGIPVTSVGPGRFAGSGLTQAALGGARYRPAEELTDRVDTTVEVLAEPGLVYLYWGEVDKVGHQSGWSSPEWGDALAELDHELGRLARLLPAGSLLVVTADHGMVDVDRAALVDVATTPELAAGVELVAGEPRATHVYLADDGPGATDRALDRWRTVLGDRAIVASRADVVAAGWFGPVAEHVLPVIGDLVVAATGHAGVVDSRTQTPHSLLLRGMHGSMTPGEMLVPLLMVG
jgi:hypothetical protein